MKKYCAAFLLALQMVGFVWTPVNADAGENRITEVQLQEEGKTGIWRKEGRKWYYRWENGDCLKDTWFFFENHSYYLKEDGKMAVDWEKIEGHWYYLSDTGRMKCGWIHDKDAWYFADEEGKMVTGWKEIQGERYYFEEETDGEGRMKTGWMCEKGKWYFFSKSGKLNRNKNQYSLGQVFRLGDSGEWIKE